MIDPPPFNALSVEYHYPDCPACGCDGAMGVVALKNHQLDEWECIHCGEQFDAGAGSDWHGVRELSDLQRKVYVDCHIRGVPAVRVAPRYGISAPKVRELLTKARKRLAASGEAPAQEVPS